MCVNNKVEKYFKFVAKTADVNTNESRDAATTGACCVTSQNPTRQESQLSQRTARARCSQFWGQAIANKLIQYLCPTIDMVSNQLSV